MKKLTTAGLLVVKDRKLLLAFSNNKQCFYLPGGKVDEGETVKTALCREIKEELGVTLEEDDLQFYTHVAAPAFGEGPAVIMEQDCFFYDGEIDPKPSAEIGAINYFTLEQYGHEKNQAPGAIMILKQLKEEGYIN